MIFRSFPYLLLLRQAPKDPMTVKIAFEFLALMIVTSQQERILTWKNSGILSISNATQSGFCFLVQAQSEFFRA